MSPIPTDHHRGEYTTLNYLLVVRHYGASDKVAEKSQVKAHGEKEIKRISITTGGAGFQVRSLTETT